MTKLVQVTARLQPGKLDEAIDFLKLRFPETRDYSGCQSIDAYVAEDGLTLCFIELWDSQDQFDSYLSWRQESGSFDQFLSMIDGELDIQSFDKLAT